MRRTRQGGSRSTSPPERQHPRRLALRFGTFGLTAAALVLLAQAPASATAPAPSPSVSLSVTTGPDPHHRLRSLLTVTDAGRPLADTVDMFTESFLRGEGRTAPTGRATAGTVSDSPSWRTSSVSTRTNSGWLPTPRAH